jgi:hypothetical protein
MFADFEMAISTRNRTILSEEPCSGSEFAEETVSRLATGVWRESQSAD